MTTSARQPARITGPELLTSIHRYRVMQGEKIVGQFSNLPLAEATAHRYRGTAVILDISVKPHLVVHKRRKVAVERGGITFSGTGRSAKARTAAGFLSGSAP